jgi:GTPase SAR1 family protein
MRVAFVGASRVGKTTLIRSALAAAYDPAPHRTHGVEFCTYNTLQLWDVAGSTRRAPIEQVMVRGARVVVLACADWHSFLALQVRWVPLVRRENAAARLVLATFKSDERGGDAHAHHAFVAAYAAELGATYTTVTATSPASVANFFTLLVNVQ